ncbi:MAG TPA: immunoglobulin domain-containing protein, partial [Lacunisphaera sp.]|nr:immunoglobulin domain-containing protein [Lacunisphaera sp.]
SPAGDRATLSVAATGTAPLEYQWLKDGGEVAGATGATLNVVLSPATAGSYRVLVRNRAGTIVSGAVRLR